MTSGHRRNPSPPAALARCMLGTVVLLFRRLRLRRTNALQFPVAFGLGRGGGGVRVSPEGLRVWSSEYLVPGWSRR